MSRHDPDFLTYYVYTPKDYQLNGIMADIVRGADGGLEKSA